MGNADQVGNHEAGSKFRTVLRGHISACSSLARRISADQAGDLVHAREALEFDIERRAKSELGHIGEQRVDGRGNHDLPTAGGRSYPGCLVHGLSQVVIARLDNVADVEADLYVMVDGDDQLDPGAAPGLVDLLVSEHLDMVTGVRVAEDEGVHRSGHAFGNRLMTGLVSWLFGRPVRDVFGAIFFVVTSGNPWRRSKRV